MTDSDMPGLSRDHRPASKARNSGVATSPTGWGLGDHICWAHGGTASWRAAAVTFLTEGAGAGEALLYAADKPAADLVADLAEMPARDALLASGQLRVAPAADLYGDPTSFDPARQVAAFRNEVLAVARQGYRGLRLAAEVTSLVPDEAGARRFASYELAVDALIATGGISAMCGYDQARLGPTLWPLACVHPLRHARPAPVEYVFHAEVGGWRVIGEVDLAVETDFRVALDVASATEGDMHLMLDKLHFIDLAGARVLAQTAERLDERRRLVLHGPGYEPRKVLRLSGWDQLANLVVEDS